MWIVFVIVLPYFEVLVYLIARGKEMSRHSLEDAQARDTAARKYIQGVTGGVASPADEIARLAELKERGVINEEEFVAGKAKVLAGS